MDSKIDGTYGAANGVSFAGAITNVQVVNNYIHHVNGDGIKFAQDPTGDVIDIQGNLFESNNGYGVDNVQEDGTFSVAYNSWGDPAGPTGPSGDGIFGFTDSSYYTPYTYAAVSMVVSDGSPKVQNAVAKDDTITYTVKIDSKNVMGVDVALVYPTDNFTYTSSSTDGTPFVNVVDAQNLFNSGVLLDVDTINGVIRFHGVANNFTAYSTVDDLNPDTLFTVTFTGNGRVIPTEFDPVNLYWNTTAADFAMAPASGPSSNIYATSLENEKVTVLAKLPITSTVSLQGRTNRSGATVSFSTDGSTYGYSVAAPATSTNVLTNNVSLADVVEDKYTITVSRPGYLTASKAMTDPFSGAVDGKTSFTGLELKGGEVTNNDAIDVNDGAVIGGEYGNTTLNNPEQMTGNVNGDGKVDIFDLALMGGNYGLTSTSAYSDGTGTTGINWLP